MAMTLLHPPPHCIFTHHRRRLLRRGQQVTPRGTSVLRAALITNEDTSSAISTSDFPLFQTILPPQPTAASLVRTFLSINLYYYFYGELMSVFSLMVLFNLIF